MAAAQSATSPDAALAEATRIERKNLMERIIETLATGLGNTVGWMAETGVLFLIFALIWVAFGAGLVLSQGSVDQAWAAIRALPFPVQVIVWLLFLPVMIALWAWESTWPFIVRISLVIGIGAWNLWMFAPRWIYGRP
jgi:hypothetical protein